MTECNYKTKKMQGFLRSYERATARTLGEVYGSYSSAKAVAYRQCLTYCHQMDGYDFRIVSHNSQCFTCGFLYVDYETGAVKFVYSTPYNDYVCDYITL